MPTLDITPADIVAIAATVESEVGKPGRANAGVNPANVAGIVGSIIGRAALGSDYDLGPQYQGTIQGVIDAGWAFSGIHKAGGWEGFVARSGLPSEATLAAVAEALASIEQNGFVMNTVDFANPRIATDPAFAAAVKASPATVRDIQGLLGTYNIRGETPFGDHIYGTRPSVRERMDQAGVPQGTIGVDLSFSAETYGLMTPAFGAVQNRDSPRERNARDALDMQHGDVYGVDPVTAVAYGGELADLSPPRDSPSMADFAASIGLDMASLDAALAQNGIDPGDFDFDVADPLNFGPSAIDAYGLSYGQPLDGFGALTALSRDYGFDAASWGSGMTFGDAPAVDIGPAYSDAAAYNEAFGGWGFDDSPSERADRSLAASPRSAAAPAPAASPSYTSRGGLDAPSERADRGLAARAAEPTVSLDFSPREAPTSRIDAMPTIERGIINPATFGYGSVPTLTTTAPNIPGPIALGNKPTPPAQAPAKAPAVAPEAPRATAPQPRASAPAVAPSRPAPAPVAPTRALNIPPLALAPIPEFTLSDYAAPRSSLPGLSDFSDPFSALGAMLSGSFDRSSLPAGVGTYASLLGDDRYGTVAYDRTAREFAQVMGLPDPFPLAPSWGTFNLNDGRGSDALNAAINDSIASLDAALSNWGGGYADPDSDSDGGSLGGGGSTGWGEGGFGEGGGFQSDRG